MPLSISSPFLSKIELLKPSKVKKKRGEKICRVFLDLRSEPEPEPHQNQTSPHNGQKLFIVKSSEKLSF